MADTQVQTAPAGSGLAGVHEEVERFRGYHLMVMFIAVMGYGTIAADAALFPTAFPLVQAEMGFSLTTVSWIYAAGFIACGIVAVFVIGPLTDRIGRKPTFQLAVTTTALFTILSGLAWDTTSFAIFRVIATIGYVEWGLSTQLISESVPGKHRATMAGVVPAGWAFGFGLSAIAAGHLGPEVGWRATFVIIGILPLIVAIASHWILKETPHFRDLKRAKTTGVTGEFNVDLDEAKKSTYRQLFAPDMRRTTIGVIIFFFFVIFQYGILSYFGLAFLDSNGIEFVDASNATTLASWLGIGSIIAIGFLARAKGSHFALTVLNLLGGLMAVGVTLIATPDTIVAWYVAFLVVTIALWGAAPNWLNETFPTRVRGTGAAGGAGFLWLGFGVMSLLVTPLLKHISWDALILLFAAVIPLLALVGLWITPRPKKLNAQLDEIHS